MVREAVAWRAYHRPASIEILDGLVRGGSHDG